MDVIFVNWYVIFVNENKLNDLEVYFSNQPGMKAFIPKIEKLMSKEGAKVFLEVPMFPNYLFIETTLNEQEFYEIIEEIEKDLGSMLNVLQTNTQSVLSLESEEKNFLESLLNENHIIMHSTGIIVDSKLIVQDGPLKGKEELIKKIDRHKRLAFLDDVFGRIVKVPLEISSKS